MFRFIDAQAHTAHRRNGEKKCAIALSGAHTNIDAI